MDDELDRQRKILVGLIDDHELVRDGVADLLAANLRPRRVTRLRGDLLAHKCDDATSNICVDRCVYRAGSRVEVHLHSHAGRTEA